MPIVDKIMEKFGVINTFSSQNPTALNTLIHKFHQAKNYVL